jgi:hypothetical protein
MSRRFRPYLLPPVTRYTRGLKSIQETKQPEFQKLFPPWSTLVHELVKKHKGKPERLVAILFEEWVYAMMRQDQLPLGEIEWRSKQKEKGTLRYLPVQTQDVETKQPTWKYTEILYVFYPSATLLVSGHFAIPIPPPDASPQDVEKTKQALLSLYRKEVVQPVQAQYDVLVNVDAERLVTRYMTVDEFNQQVEKAQEKKEKKITVVAPMPVAIHVEPPCAQCLRVGAACICRSAFLYRMPSDFVPMSL